MPAKPTIGDVIALVESNNNERAIRFEPGIYQNIRLAAMIDVIRLAHNSLSMNYGTSRVIYAMSFGKFQLMGFNVWKYYKGTFYDFLANANKEQEIALAHFLNDNRLDVISADCEILFAHGEFLHEFASKYNGPGDTDAYAEKMAKAYMKLTATA